jgi:hypothetical protein
MNQDIQPARLSVVVRVISHIERRDTSPTVLSSIDLSSTEFPVVETWNSSSFGDMCYLRACGELLARRVE